MTGNIEHVIRYPQKVLDEFVETTTTHIPVSKRHFHFVGGLTNNLQLEATNFLKLYGKIC